MTTLLDGKKVAGEIKDELSKKLNSSGASPNLAAILVGDDPASKTYLELKDKDCTEVGIGFENFQLPADTSMEEVLELIDQLNGDEEIDGIIVQFPVPDHMDGYRITEEIDPKKDVDGLHPYNIGRLWKGKYDIDGDLVACTPKGIMRLIDRYGIETDGERVVIINRSDLVGKPLAKLLLDRDATVTVCHSKTEDIGGHAESADILITAVGARPNFVVTEDMVKEDAVVIDVGMNHMEDGLCGDVEFDEVKDKTSYITPVPGGVGPMTRVTLLENVFVAAGIGN